MHDSFWCMLQLKLPLKKNGNYSLFSKKIRKTCCYKYKQVNNNVQKVSIFHYFMQHRYWEIMYQLQRLVFNWHLNLLEKMEKDACMLICISSWTNIFKVYSHARNGLEQEEWKLLWTKLELKFQELDKPELELNRPLGQVELE